MKAPGGAREVETWLDRLRHGGVKITPNRRRVLERFLAGEGPWTLGSLHRSLSQDAPCDASSVYRALEALRDAGLLEEFQLPGDRQTWFSLVRHGSPRRGQATADHHHHHIVCQDCGKVTHLEMCLPTALMGKIEGASGFRITEHRLEFRGVCGDCR